MTRVLFKTIRTHDREIITFRYSVGASVDFTRINTEIKNTHSLVGIIDKLVWSRNEK